MARQVFPAFQHQPITVGLQLPVAHLQTPSTSVKRQDPRHGMAHPILVGQALAKEQHAPAFGIDRLTPEAVAQAGHALFAFTEFLGVEFGKSTWED